MRVIIDAPCTGFSEGWETIFKIQTAFCLLLALLFSIPQAISAEVRDGTAIAVRPEHRFDSIHIGNFEQINQGVLRGAAPSDQDIRALASSGVRTIVNLRMGGAASAREERLAKELGVEYIHVPMGFSKPSSDKLKTVLQTLVDKEKQPVFVHCRQGADRTGIVIAMYRMLVDRWDFDAAYIEMRHHHFKPWLASMKKAVHDCRQIAELDSLKGVAFSTELPKEASD